MHSNKKKPGQREQAGVPIVVSQTKRPKGTDTIESINYRFRLSLTLLVSTIKTLTSVLSAVGMSLTVTQIRQQSADDKIK